MSVGRIIGQTFRYWSPSIRAESFTIGSSKRRFKCARSAAGKVAMAFCRAPRSHIVRALRGQDALTLPILPTADLTKHQKSEDGDETAPKTQSGAVFC